MTTTWNPAETTTEDLIATVARCALLEEDWLAAALELDRRCGLGTTADYAKGRHTPVGYVRGILVPVTR